MHASAQKEQFSLAYVHAVASAAGFNYGRYHVDEDSVDVLLNAPDNLGPVSFMPLKLQLKCTSSLSGNAEHWSFRLKRKNFEELRIGGGYGRAFLVVVHVPRQVSDWLIPGDDCMTLSRHAYWLSLKDQHPLPPGQQSATVHVPRKNVFDVDGLHGIIDDIARGVL